MMYYTFELDEESKEICVIVTPWGKFRYEHLPMGMHQAPDIAHEFTDGLLNDVQDVEVYMDNIALLHQVGRAFQTDCTSSSHFAS